MYHNLIFCRHEGDPKAYLFTLPLNAKLKVGDVVIVDTIRGEAQAVATSSSFHVDDQALKAIVSGVGAYHPIKPVLYHEQKAWVDIA